MFSMLKPRIVPIFERRLGEEWLAWEQIEEIGFADLSTWGPEVREQRYTTSTGSRMQNSLNL